MGPFSRSADLEPLEFRKARCFRIEAPEGVTSEQDGGGDREQIVGAKPVPCCTPQGEFLELPFEFRHWDQQRTEKFRPLPVTSEICVCQRRLLGRDERLSCIPRLKHMQLKRIQDLHSAQLNSGWQRARADPLRTAIAPLDANGAIPISCVQHGRWLAIQVANSKYFHRRHYVGVHLEPQLESCSPH